MELLTKIGDYYIVKDLYLSEDKFTQFSIVIHKIMRQFLFAIRFSKQNFNYTYYRSQREIVKQLPYSIKQIDSFFTNQENYLFFEFFDSGNIISFIRKYYETELINIPHRLVHKFMQDIVSNLKKIESEKLPLIEDLFLDNLYLTREKYTLNLGLIKDLTKEISNESFNKRLSGLEEITNRSKLIEYQSDLSVKLLFSFKKEFFQFHNLNDYNILRVSEEEKSTKGRLVRNIGVICFYLINNYHIINKIPIDKSFYSLTISNDLPSELIDLLQRCLSKSLSNRLTLEDLFNHPYVKKNYEELTFPFKEKKIKGNECINLNFNTYIHVNYLDYIHTDDSSNDFLSYFENYSSYSDQIENLKRKENENNNTNIYNEELINDSYNETARFVDEKIQNSIQQLEKDKRNSLTSIKEEHIYIKPADYQEKKFSFNDEKLIENKQPRSIDNIIIENYFDEKYLSFKGSKTKGLANK